MIDRFVDDVHGQLVASRRRRKRIVDEIRDHLDDASAALIASGLEVASAEQRAVAAFGDASEIAWQLNADLAGASIRRAPLIMGVTGSTIVAGFVLAAIGAVQPAFSRPAGMVQQVAFFVALLGLQVAFVAGARALARVSAIWRTRPRLADQLLVRRASFVFAGGSLTSVTGWIIALAARQGGGATAALVAGVAVMIGTSIAAALALLGRRVATLDDPSSAGDGDVVRHPRNARLEQSIAALTRWPRLSCAAIALAGAGVVMSHAETSVTAALPWGAVEAAAVIVGFVVLGPVLELRDVSRSS